MYSCAIFILMLFHFSFFIFHVFFSGGLSLGLTVAGIATGLAGGATTLTAIIVQDKNVKADTKKIREAFRRLQPREKLLERLSVQIKVTAAKIRVLETDFMKIGVVDAGHIKKSHGVGITKLAGKGAGVGYGVWSLGKGVYDITRLNIGLRNVRTMKVGIVTTRNIARAIQTDIAVKKAIGQAMTQVAVDKVVTPGVSIFGKSIITAGSTAAKTLSVSFGALSIAFGVMEIVGGVQDIKYSKGIFLFCCYSFHKIQFTCSKISK